MRSVYSQFWTLFVKRSKANFAEKGMLFWWSVIEKNKLFCCSQTSRHSGEKKTNRQNK